MSEQQQFHGFEIDEDRVIVTTSRGHRLVCLPVMTMIDGIDDEEQTRAFAEVGVPPIPTYTVTDVAGDEQEFEYDQEGIDDPTTPEEDRAAWVLRQERLAEALALAKVRSDERLMRTLAVSGTVDLDAEPPEVWIPRHEYLGWTVPESAYERLHHYFTREAIGAQEDGFKIMAGIAAASGMSKEVLAQIEARFRSDVGNAAAVADQEDATGEGDTEEAEELVDRVPLHGDGSPGENGDGGHLADPELVG